MADSTVTSKDTGSDADSNLPNPVVMGKAMTDIASRSQRLVTDWLKRQSTEGQNQSLDPFNVGGAFLEMTAKLMTDPARLVQAQMTLWNDYMSLWQQTAQRLLGQEAEPVIAPARDDKRFKDKAWDENVLFDYIKQSYLLSARWLQTTVNDVDGLDDKTAKKVDFYTRQFVSAMAPSNFVLTNPEVLRTTLESRGENLLNGLNNLLTDLERGKGQLQISQTDYSAFEVGKNLAVTPGKVVYQNDLMQLLMYTPTTETVAKQPLLIVMPWINKFYILDLKPKNSFIKWAVDQGHTVFVTSWVNPDAELSKKTFDDYLTEGPLTALDVIKDITGESDVNAIGYCLGGTLLSCTLAYMAVKGDDRIKSATFFTTMSDFSEPGELGIFIDEEQISGLEKAMSEKGYLEGSTMATTFNMLRANDLIWSFVVNNYLLGKDPFPFDLLYWNSDSTRMPAVMHSFYLRKMYQENLLKEPGGVTLCGVPIDLRKINVPIFMLSAKEDHIAPWQSTYALTQMVGGPAKFCLAASGHIAGVVNPPAAGKYCYWTQSKTPKSPDAWFNGTKQSDGSWWPEWQRWVSKFGGEQVPAREPGTGKYKAIEDAPGAYVKMKS